MGEILEHDTKLWAKAVEADRRVTEREGDLIDAWRDFGACLNRLRIDPSDKRFGDALREHGIDRTRQHLSAAMWLARLDEDQLSTLREIFPTALHPKTLQDRCRETFPEWIGSSRESGVPSGDTSSSSPPEPANTPDPAPQEPVEVSVPIQESDIPVATVKKVSGKAEVEQILREYFVDTKSVSRMRKLLNERQQKRLAEIIQNNERMPKTYGKAWGGDSKFSARAFIPNISTGFTRRDPHIASNSKQINKILDNADNYLRMAFDLGDKIGDSTAEFSWWHQNVEMANAVVTPVSSNAASVPETRIEDSGMVYLHDGQKFGAKEPIPGADKQQIVVYGEQVWPPRNGHRYSFADAWAAYNLWRQLDGQYARTMLDPASRGRAFMSLAMWLHVGSQSFSKAWHVIAAAQFGNPNKSDQCSCPDQRR